MCVLCIRKDPDPFGALPWVVKCCLFCGLLLYSAGSGVNRVQVVLSGFSVRLFCFVQAKTFCRYGCVYFLLHSGL